MLQHAIKVYKQNGIYTPGGLRKAATIIFCAAIRNNY